MSLGQSFNAFASGLSGSVGMAKDRKFQQQALDQNSRMMETMARMQGIDMPSPARGLPQEAAEPRKGLGGLVDRIRGAGEQLGERLGVREPDPEPGLEVPSAPIREGYGRPAPERGRMVDGYSVGTPRRSGSGGGLFDLLREHEGAGDPDTLFGHSQKDGPFSGVRVSNMTVGEAIDFAKPTGPYAKWVASKNNGTVATPMGEGQIVGSTLRRAASAMGLDPSTPFNQDTQRAVIDHLARQRLAAGQTMPEKLRQIRSEWVGFRNVPDDQLIAAISQYERSNPRGGRGIPRRATQ